MKLDPNKDLFSKSLIAASELNTQEFIRIVKKIRLEGKGYEENYNKKIDRVVVEDISKRRVHVIYVWEECSDDNIDILHLKYVKRLKK